MSRPAQDQRPEQRRAEAIDVEPVQYAGGGPEHERVDDEEKKADGDDGDRQRQHHQHGPQHHVEQANDKGRDQRGGEALHFHTAVDIGHKQQRCSAEKPFQEEFHGRRIAPAEGTKKCAKREPSPWQSAPALTAYSKASIHNAPQPVSRLPSVPGIGDQPLSGRTGAGSCAKSVLGRRASTTWATEAPAACN